MFTFLQMLSILFLLICAVIWFFVFRKIKKHAPWWKLGLGIFILGLYSAFTIWYIKHAQSILLGYGGIYLDQKMGALAMIAVPLFFIIAVISIAVPIIIVFIARRDYLVKNIIAFVLIGSFLSFFCLLDDNNVFITGNKYIIYYIKDSGKDFDLGRAKQLTHDPNLKTSDGVPLLPLAIRYEKYDYADYLISKSADVDFYDEWGGWVVGTSPVPYRMKQYLISRNIPGFDLAPRRLSVKEAAQKTKLALLEEITPDAYLARGEDGMAYLCSGENRVKLE